MGYPADAQALAGGFANGVLSAIPFRNPYDARSISHVLRAAVTGWTVTVDRQADRVMAATEPSCRAGLRTRGRLGTRSTSRPAGARQSLTQRRFGSPQTKRSEAPPRIRRVISASGGGQLDGQVTREPRPISSSASHDAVPGGLECVLEALHRRGGLTTPCKQSLT